MALSPQVGFLQKSAIKTADGRMKRIMEWKLQRYTGNLVMERNCETQESRQKWTNPADAPWVFEAPFVVGSQSCKCEISDDHRFVVRNLVFDCDLVRVYPEPFVHANKITTRQALLEARSCQIQERGCHNKCSRFVVVPSNYPWKARTHCSDSAACIYRDLSTVHEWWDPSNRTMSYTHPSMIEVWPVTTESVYALAIIRGIFWADCRLASPSQSSNIFSFVTKHGHWWENDKPNNNND